MFWRRQKTKNAAGDVAQVIEALALHDLGGLCQMVREKFGQSPSDHASYQAFVELVVFYVHLIDRRAFESLGAAGRSEFVDRVGSDLLTNVPPKLRSGTVADTFPSDFSRVHNMRGVEYSPYPLVSPPGEGPANTYGWEAAKNVVRHLTAEPEAIFHAYVILSAGMTALFESRPYRSIRR